MRPASSEFVSGYEKAGADFKTIGRVTDNISTEGMGIEFIEIEPIDRVVLQKWLCGETPVNDSPTKLLVAGLFLLVGTAVIAAVALMIYELAPATEAGRRVRIHRLVHAKHLQKDNATIVSRNDWRRETLARLAREQESYTPTPHQISMSETAH